MTPVLQAAHAYVARKWNPLPLPFKSKIPQDAGWPERVIGEADLQRFFNGKEQNVGVVLGPSSNNLTDVDLDCLEATSLAPQVLPKTGAIFGRASAPASHWLYRTKLASTNEDENAAFQFKDPTRPEIETMLLEVRVGGFKGAQTVFPGSVHETGEEIRWDEAGVEAEVDGNDLLKRARLLASVCLLARYWPGPNFKGRHDAALGVGGFLARAGLKVPQVKYLVEAIARAAGDNEPKDRRDTAEDAAQEFYKGKPARGYPQFAKTFGDAIAKQVAEWLNYRGANNGVSSTAANNGHLLSNDITTEQSAALQFVEDHGEQFRYCRSTKSWFHWNGAIWLKDERGVAYHWAGELSSRLGEDQSATTRIRIGRASFCNGVEKFAQHNPQLVMTADDWDKDPMLLGTPGGTVDLKTGRRRTSYREDDMTKMTSVAPPEPLASGGVSTDQACPLWIKFLNETTGNDSELIRFLQRWCGYGLTGLTNEHALVFVYGPGGNGKSVFLNVVKAIMGSYAVTAAMDTFTASRSDKHPTDLAMLRGARFVTASETEEGRAWAERRIKEMTGGDPITARFMQKDFFTYTPQFKLTIIGNHQPVLHNVDEAARRRFNIAPFILKPAKVDRELEVKLLREAPAILQWMIDGCLDWQEDGLSRPASVIAATEAYFADQDQLGQWLDECCEVDLADRTMWEEVHDLFESWTGYAQKAGEPAGTKKAFSTSLMKRSFERDRLNKMRIFRRLRLKTEPFKMTRNWHEKDD